MVLTVMLIYSCFYLILMINIVVPGDACAGACRTRSETATIDTNEFINQMDPKR